MWLIEPLGAQALDAAGREAGSQSVRLWGQLSLNLAPLLITNGIRVKLLLPT